MKNTLLSLAAAMLLLASCEPKNTIIPITDIIITPTPSPLTLTVGGAPGSLLVEVAPADATSKTVELTVAPEGVVTVDDRGIVTPVGPGTATITAKSLLGDVTETCEVRVNALLRDVNVHMNIEEGATTADLVMKQVAFASRMPVMDITVPGVTLTTTTDGGYTISGEGIIPTTVMGGQTVEVDMYTITGLGGNYASGTLTFAMKCGTYPLTYSGTLATDGAGFFGDMTVAPPAAE